MCARVCACSDRVQGFEACVCVQSQGAETVGGLQNVDYAEMGVSQTDSRTVAEPTDPSAVINLTRVHSIISSRHSQTRLASQTAAEVKRIYTVPTTTISDTFSYL